MCIYGSEKIGYTPNREDVKWKEYKDSIKNLYNTLPQDTIILAGHGERTTIGQEKLGNPYIRG